MNQDSRITAYATGELQGREREIFETEMAASDLLHGEVESMSVLAKQLAAAKPTDRFTAEERARLLAKCTAARKSRKVARTSVKVVLWTTVGAAACLVVFAGFVAMVGQGSGPFLMANRMDFEPSAAELPRATAAHVAAPQISTESSKIVAQASPSAPARQTRAALAMPDPSDLVALRAQTAQRAAVYAEMRATVRHLFRK
jgi:hypothetical protein